MSSNSNHAAAAQGASVVDLTHLSDDDSFKGPDEGVAKESAPASAKKRAAASSSSAPLKKKKKKIKSDGGASACKQNFLQFLERATAEHDVSGFAGLRSGTRLYGWLYRQKSQVEEYDRFVENGGTNEEFDLEAQKTSLALTSDMVETVRPLVNAFKSHARVPHERCADDDFFNTSGFLMDQTLPCKNQLNQSLYHHLVAFGEYRLLIGSIRKNKGHFNTGKKWLAVAKRVLKVMLWRFVCLFLVTCLICILCLTMASASVTQYNAQEKSFVHSMARAQAANLGVPGKGILKEAFDHFFTTGRFPDERQTF